MKLTQVTIVKEGGNALKSAGVGRIQKQDIPATIHMVSQVSGIPVEDLHPLGSVGKAADSGDIDLGVDIKKHDADAVHKRIIDSLGDDYGIYNKGTYVGSYAFPIAGDQSKGLVQVDLMYTPNPEWATFAYHSPGTASQYKGVVRTVLLIAVAANYGEPGTDHFEFDPTSGELIIRAGRTLDLSSGLRRIFQFRPKNKKTDQYLKTMKSITIDEFKGMFPDIEVNGNEIVIDDPNKVLTILFGNGVKPKDVNTAEQVIKLINSKFTKEEQQKIFSKAAIRLQPFAEKMELPPEIKEYM